MNGHYIPALTAPDSGQQLEQALSIKKASFKEAAQTCYELGKEVVIKVVHSDKSLQLHTDALLPPTIPANASYDSLKKQVRPTPYQVCLANKDPHKKPLPSELKPIDENCSIPLDETNTFGTYQLCVYV